jgi:cytochrome c biogenesis protein CcmG/thiol:disulfide interchange protein DsbE
MEDTATAVPEAPGARNRWGTVAWIGASILLVVLVVGIWLRVNADRAGSNLANAIIAGERPAAPALPTDEIARDGAPGLPDWYRATPDGHQRPNPDGEVLVVNWWASWCGPCRDEAPILRELADDYDGRVTVVGLDAGFEDLESDARAFVREHELDFPIVRGTRADHDAWGVRGYPETYVVGTDGRISSFINGPIDEQTLRGLLERELDEERT